MGSPSGARIARASTCYPYYHTWKHILCSGEKVRPMMPQCPLMFLHGTAGVKKIMVSVFWYIPRVCFHAQAGSSSIGGLVGICSCLWCFFFLRSNGRRRRPVGDRLPPVPTARLRWVCPCHYFVTSHESSVAVFLPGRFMCTSPARCPNTFPHRPVLLPMNERQHTPFQHRFAHSTAVAACGSMIW